MTEKSTNELRSELDETLGVLMDKADRLFDAARPDAVFAAPVTAEGRTVIGAAEVLVGTMFGGGGGSGGSGIMPGDGDGVAAATARTGTGVGAGIGGFAQSRPVAVIIIDRDGVRVEPVVDATKLGIAGLTVFGSMLFLLGRMIRGAKRVG